jgi:hypothetical protein
MKKLLIYNSFILGLATGLALSKGLDSLADESLEQTELLRVCEYGIFQGYSGSMLDKPIKTQLKSSCGIYKSKEK